jgi:hypothetical protein
MFDQLRTTLIKQQENYIKNIEDLKEQIHKYFGE